MMMTEALRPWIRSAQSGNTEATAFVAESFIPLVKQISKSYRWNANITEDEAQSSAWQGVFRCIMEYDLSRPGYVPYYMTKYIRKFVTNCERRVKIDNKYVKDWQEEDGSMTDVPKWLCDQRAADPLEEAIKKVLLQEVFKIYNTLPLSMQRAIFLRCHGYTFSEIAAKIHTTYFTARRDYLNGIEALRRRLVETELRGP